MPKQTPGAVTPAKDESRMVIIDLIDVISGAASILEGVYVTLLGITHRTDEVDSKLPMILAALEAAKDNLEGEARYQRDRLGIGQ